MELVTLNNDKPVTTSLKIAEKFGKRHDNVTRAIETLLASKSVQEKTKSGLLKIEGVEIIKKNAIGGEVKRLFYHLDREAFTLLAMGFTGEKALNFKLDYMAAFNAMEERVKSLTPALPDFSNPVDAARAWADAKEAEQKAITHAEKLENENRKARPKVIYYDWVANAPDTMSMNQAAKLMNIKDVGRVNLYKKLREWGIIMPGGTEPYQRYINQGWFKMEDVTKETSRGIRLFPTTRVTRKGLQKIYGMFLEEGQLDLVIVSGKPISLGHKF
ncbi:Rha family transcriptional regulator [Desulfoluna spongiiphila]|uniref:Anti-repressor protein n=1 Tax=Desulfoluna spongiiphila TaxID=419481 RepID=A0A1G5G3P5_9BACT|nr:phage regulatory protein/antirepressor Ant [Desulfoluna spongiiphila]SCY45308.1 anti-repressor protein [Desulfoluna spongiiphila]